MDLYVKYELQGPPDCDHNSCLCKLQVIGQNQFEGYAYEISLKDKDVSVANFFADLTARFRLEQGQIVHYDGDLEVDRFLSRIKPGQDFLLVPTQLDHKILPNPVELVQPTELMRTIFRVADAKHFEKLCRKIITPQQKAAWRRTVWQDTPIRVDDRPNAIVRPVPKLQDLALRVFSMYRAAYGKTNGRQHAISALADLYPNKWADACLKQIRTVHTAGPSAMLPLKGLNQAIEYLYHHLGTRNKWGTLKPEITFDGLEETNMGTSAGLNKGKPITKDGDIPLKIGTKKKLETFEADCHSILDYLTDDEARDLFVVFNNTGKNEIFYSNKKQIDEDEYAAWRHKCRLFVIPSSIFILMERMVSELRQMLERRGPICVGMKWSRAGMDIIARKLRIDILNEWLHILVEGDVENFDQSVWERFIDLYFSFGLVYDIPEGDDYKMRKKMTKFLIRTVIVRLTHMFGEMWGFKIGGMPSGIYNTSHGDSWIMCLWFFLFGVFQIANAPEEDKEMLEKALLWLIAIIVYGDDHVYNKTSDPKIQRYFGGSVFVHFMKEHFGVKIRGLKDGVSFLSSHSGGNLVHCGMTFCRQQAVYNPHKGEGQPRYLPFRENFEFWVRAGWGRDVRERGPVELMLSCIGHAYGTYASNRVAYDGLYFLYETALNFSYDPTQERFLIEEAMTDMSSSDFQEFRRRGVDPAEILNGFPTWETLIKKNKMDERYHVCDQERIPFEYTQYSYSVY